MNAMMKHTVLAVCMLFAAGSAWGVEPRRAQADSLLGAEAMVVKVNAAANTVLLKVPSTGHKPLTFVVSPSCLFTDGLLSMDNLYPNVRVLVWTQGSQAGTLPVIYRIARAVN